MKVIFKPLHVLLVLVCYFGSITCADEWYNPCDWGCHDFHRTWTTWVGYEGVVNNYSDTTNCNCPPYNKTAGHNSCLQQFSIPDPFNVFYLKMCAEQSPYSDYFSPKIRVRAKTCNIACWTQTEDLNGDGECTYFPTPLAVPLIRICARVANPADPTGGPPANADGTGPPTGIAADDGYTLGTQLNARGETINDPVYEGTDGNPVKIVSPKICAYFDPCLWDTLLNAAFPGLALVGMASIGQIGGDAIEGIFDPDFTDVNPVKQPLHQSSGISPFFKLIITLIEQAESLSDTFQNLSSMLTSKLPSGVGSAIKVIIQVLTYTQFIDYAIQSGIAKAGIELLKVIGQLNRVVVHRFGCVEVPLGPMPPPYCPVLGAVPQLPVVHSICSSSVIGNNVVTQLSTSIKPCVSSPQRNNFIHNSIRVGLDNQIPLCKGADVSKASSDPNFDRCVNIVGYSTKGIPPSTANIHLTTVNDLIKLCDPVSPQSPCIESAYLSKIYGNSGWLSTSGARIVYGSKSGQYLTDNYYYDTEPSVLDCATHPNSLCQTVWGVNIGPYTDLSVSFNDTELSYNSAKQVASGSITDEQGVQKQFQAVVLRKEDAAFTQIIGEICVYYSSDVALAYPIGCSDRPMPPIPQVQDCSVSGLCQSSFFNPKMVVSLTVGSDKTQGVVGPPIYNNQSIESIINLGGYEYGAYATSYDPTGSFLLKQPFSGPKSVVPSSIFGTYINDAVPYDGYNPSNINTEAIYVKGLEYTNGGYVLGGQQLCLTGYTVSDCVKSVSQSNCITQKSQDPVDIAACMAPYQANCVLTNLKNASTIACSAFQNMLLTYPGITLCNPLKFCTLQLDGTYSCDNSKSCNSNVKTLSGLNNNTVSVKKCSDDSYCYSYTGANVGELCELTEGSSDRANPSSSFGPSLSPSSYYPYNPMVTAGTNAQQIAGTYSANAPNYDTQAVRNKTDIENNLCTQIPLPPDCSAITSPGLSDGNATWSQTHVGVLATGQCKSGYGPSNGQAPTRYCTINKTTRTSQFSDLISAGCKPGVSDIVISGTLPSSTCGKTINSSKISLSKCSASTGFYTSNVTLNIGDKSKLASFNLLKVGVDDYLQVLVNGTIVYMARGDYGKITTWTGQITETYTFGQTSPNVDLLPYLQNGNNIIEFKLYVVGGGALSYDIGYSIKP